MNAAGVNKLAEFRINQGYTIPDFCFGSLYVRVCLLSRHLAANCFRVYLSYIIPPINSKFPTPVILRFSPSSSAVDLLQKWNIPSQSIMLQKLLCSWSQIFIDTLKNDVLSATRPLKLCSRSTQTTVSVLHNFSNSSWSSVVSLKPTTSDSYGALRAFTMFNFCATTLFFKVVYWHLSHPDQINYN